MALCTSVGIHFTWNAATDTFAIIGVATFLKSGLWDWLIQWAVQHASYKTFIVPAETLGEILKHIQRMNPPPVSEGAAKAVGLPESAVRP